MQTNKITRKLIGGAAHLLKHDLLSITIEQQLHASACCTSQQVSLTSESVAHGQQMHGSATAACLQQQAILARSAKGRGRKKKRQDSGDRQLRLALLNTKKTMNSPGRLVHSWCQQVSDSNGNDVRPALPEMNWKATAWSFSSWWRSNPQLRRAWLKGKNQLAVRHGRWRGDESSRAAP